MRIAAHSVGTCLLLAALACAPPGADTLARTDRFLYADTKRLVELVEDAAGRIERDGTAAFEEFARPGSRWRTAPTYLFVYDAGGKCVFHGKTPELVGRDLIGLRDAHGKKVIEEIVDVARHQARDASGWVFYMWEEQTELLPTWKASYIRKAVAPDGRVYAIGSGANNLKVEKAFVEGVVDRAVAELENDGREALFADLRAAGSPYEFLGSFVFVLDARGRLLVDPSFPTISGRDMSEFRDAVGRPVIREAIEKLARSDVAWVQYLWNRPGERMPSRKLMYLRKVTVGGDVLLVGSDIYLPTPIWMRL